MSNDTTKRQAALTAGIGFLLSFAGAILTGVFISKHIVDGDAAVTVANISQAKNLVYMGIFSWLIVILGDIIRAWGLYVFFKDVNKSVALLSAWFMLLHDAVLAVSVICLVVAAMIINGANIPAGVSGVQGQDLAMLLFRSFDLGFETGLFFFSFHLLLVGYLVWKSGYVKKIFSVLLVIAGLGYMINSIGILVLPGIPESVWLVLMGPCLIGELAIVLWLVIKGRKH